MKSKRREQWVWLIIALASLIPISIGCFALAYKSCFSQIPKKG